MFSRATLIVLTLFWLTMNVLLWRAEYGGRAALGSTLPVRVVWDKVLTAPDSSSLTLFHKGKKIGFCHWITSVGEDLTKMSASDVPPEGMVRRISDYRLELDGNVALEGPKDRLRFDSHLALGKNQIWQQFDLRISFRSEVWEIRSAAAEQSARVSWQEDEQKFDQVFKFAELENPQGLLREFGGPFAAGIVSGLGLPDVRNGPGGLASGLKWEARHASIQLGHSRVRAYRLSARLFDRYEAVMFVSRVGELLRVELPDGIVLANDQLGGG